MFTSLRPRGLQHPRFPCPALSLGEGSGTPLQFTCLENPMDGGAWWVAVHGVAKSQARLSDFTFTFHFHALEKEMATHSSILAWRIPGTGEPGGLPSMGSHRVGHEWSDLAAAAAAQSPGACSNSCPLSQWCHPTISSYVPPSPPAFCKKKKKITHTTVRWWDLSGPLCVGSERWLIRAGRSFFLWLCTSRSYDGAGEVHPLPTWSFFSSFPENPSCLLQAPHPLAPWVLATIITQDTDSQFRSPRFGSADTGDQ